MDNLHIGAGRSGFGVFVALILTLVLSPLFGHAEAQVRNPEGDPLMSRSSDIWPQTLQGRHFNEFWSYHIYLDDGLKLHIDFTMANFGRLKSPVSGLRVSVNNFDGELYQLNREYPLENLVRDRERHMLRLHPERDIWFEGKLPDDHRIRVRTSKDGVDYDIDLRFEEIVQGVRWQDGNFQVGSEQIGIVTHIPYAGVRGTVGINDRRKDVHGTAYMDHTYYDQNTTRVMRSAYRYISHQSEDDWDLFYFMMPRDESDHRTVGYRLSKRGGERKLDGIERMEVQSRRAAFSSRVSDRITLTLESGETVQMERTADQERNSFLAELGSIARRAARAYLGGEVVVYRGEGRLLFPDGDTRKIEYNLLQVE